MGLEVNLKLSAKEVNMGKVAMFTHKVAIVIMLG